MTDLPEIDLPSIEELRNLPEPKLFIEVKDGKAIGHPMTESNMNLLFPNFDPNNPPDPFYKFKRKIMPKIGIFEKYNGVTYELQDGVFTDVFHIEELPDKNVLIENWFKNNPKPFPSWIFNEKDCVWEPPKIRPSNPLDTVWFEPSQEWLSKEEAGKISYDLLLSPCTKDLGALEKVSQLPENFTGEINSGYFVKEDLSMYIWDGQKWYKWSPKLQQLKYQTIIDANINGTQVKILGVFDSLDELPAAYTGDIADGYIVDNINMTYAWDGEKWIQATVTRIGM